VLADGYLGQMTGRVELPKHMVRPGLPAWAVHGDAEHRENLICSIYLSEPDLEAHNVRLNEKYALIRRNEQRAASFHTKGARTLVIACNTPARMARGVVKRLRDEDLPVGLLQPITLWPVPSDTLRPLLDHVTDIVVVEAGAGQLADEVRLAIAEMDRRPPAIHTVQRLGGMLPTETEIDDALRAVTAGGRPVEV
jgi:pyruvate/2-oxoacid:ferredoxin oxidoreductase alpha subunit